MGGDWTGRVTATPRSLPHLPRLSTRRLTPSEDEQHPASPHRATCALCLRGGRRDAVYVFRASWGSSFGCQRVVCHLARGPRREVPFGAGIGANDCAARRPPRLYTASSCSSRRFSDDTRPFCAAPCPSVGPMWTMKLWDSLATCLILLSAVCAGPLPRSRREPTSNKRRARELPPVRIRLSVTSQGVGRVEAETAETADWEEALAAGEKHIMGDTFLPSDFENVVDFIEVSTSRTRRSSSPTSSSNTSSPSPSQGAWSSRTRHRRERKKGGNQQPSARGAGAGAGTGAGSRGGGRAQGCVLKQIHLNVSDLGLGYRSGEEMIFRYCSGPCRRSETNYDKILRTLAHSRRLPAREAPPQACCRPIAFDDDLSFLDDSLVYHTVRKHSARKCGCV
ncbi:glial cell line-derived neurotrophic factor-like [Betta splendens]|uniref:Glial cell line-derived neurotrophic factor n=1 Tax=Betta splendens TaxID=158456 RepID=A0A6P7NPP6_BETSP|nr:glial cell line-derived neurotrophic factor-like [Betta splendens]